MGSGKTTAGRLVAERLGRPFIDSDEQVEARSGRTVAEIFAADGEPAFRSLEAGVLAGALTAPEASVIAAAGGVVLDPANRALLRDGATVVWLRVGASVVHDRIQRSGDDHRPLLADDPAAVLQQMAEDREPLYREVADLTIDVDHLAPAAVADQILTALPRSGGSGRDGATDASARTGGAAARTGGGQP